MTSDIDVFRSAQLLVKQHGEDAPIEAAMWADAMLESGDRITNRKISTVGRHHEAKATDRRSPRLCW